MSKTMKWGPRAVDSKVYQKARPLWVYTPAGYDAARKTPYDVLVAFDGQDYLKDLQRAKNARR